MIGDGQGEALRGRREKLGIGVSLEKKRSDSWLLIVKIGYA